MLSNRLISKIADAFVLCSYLRDLAAAVGSIYKRNLVRFEHGPGTGFFGVSNTGSSDCAKECFRGITDALGQNKDNWSNIAFRSAACRDIRKPDFKKVHRVEHTVSVAELYLDFESKYIVANQEFSANLIGDYVVRNHVVSLIEQRDQIDHGTVKVARPFSRYSCEIYFGDRDVTEVSLGEIQELNANRFSSLLSEIELFDFSEPVDRSTTKFVCGQGPHTLPPLRIAIQHGLCDLQLVHRHYMHKCSKRISPGSAWYSPIDAERYRQFLIDGPDDVDEC